VYVMTGIVSTLVGSMGYTADAKHYPERIFKQSEHRNCLIGKTPACISPGVS
jgi:hypothetical protein